MRITGTIARIIGFFTTSVGITAMKALRIRAVVFQESGWWCAQCLEYDIATQARSIADLKSELERVLMIHAELAVERGQDPFTALPKAPERYFQMYDAFERANGTEDGNPIKTSAASAAQCILARFAYPQMALN